MSVVIFDGVRFAIEKELILRSQVSKLKKKGVTPKLVSILVGENKKSKLFLSLKKKAAQRVGVELEVVKLDSDTRINELIHRIRKFNNDKKVQGVMVQLPLPKRFSKTDGDRIINSIARKKDIDGMRDDSPFLTPVAKAVLEVVKEALNIVRPSLKARPYKVVVVGAKGFIGRKIVKVLKEMSYQVKGVDLETKDLKSKTRKADILICATGVPGLIKGSMVKDKSIVIDVGAPKGDVLFNEEKEKASFISKKQTLFISPVPGGVGPVTIASLLENLIEAAKRIEK